MDDQPTHAGGAPEEPKSAAPEPTVSPARRKRSWLGLKLLGIFVVVPVLLFVGWTMIVLNWSYSNGERAGYIQKFSQKGWVCKTWEGDIAMSTIPGSMPEHFLFSVRNDSVAREITKLMGARVALSYQEHRGIPGSCFGETRYHVIGVKPVAGP